MDEAETGAAVSAMRAVAHPVRLQMLSLLTGTEMSAAEVARELDLTHANASYHLRVLVDADEIVVAGEEKIRGGVAKRYRYPHERRGEHARPDRPTSDDQVFYARALGQEIERRIQQRRTDGGSKGFNSDLEGWVSPDAWAKACELLAEASFLLHEANRAPRTPGTIHVSHTAWAFQMEQP
ncbi:helix-turn-helix domain-containing protein [Nocardioides sp.]|uniref:ArsR/SmtB family transcription factor n=1 Tax=Nocardioides sp. TaxID=35761 RepID=UPI00261C79DC|nr:helix-turn-helix domain-containing protein [Nocardioides sp.]